MLLIVGPDVRSLSWSPSRFYSFVYAGILINPIRSKYGPDVSPRGESEDSADAPHW